ncbi:hypothetical protein [Croceicoccus bisphenolivorans]|nr:hypothetical protein [Croceicoccus bisphenolivorans]
MAQKIARAVAYPLHNRGETVMNVARFAIVTGSALAVIMAGPGLPF